MQKPGSRIRAESFGTRTEQGQTDTENTFRWTDVRDAARQSAGLHPEAGLTLLHPSGALPPPMAGHPAMRILDRTIMGLSLVAGPLLLLLSVAGLFWAALCWVGLV